ncbi:MAG: tetratricopeptide repeat protein [Candidatus Thermoplasmatota archaeon]|nr:tetratricopeptide repeat protein [Euryarchaeota archaeon]MBU4031982.1 tetratricopeptide repeat protein [Candidatus Thermoplasmatota archaeon]MBU4144519.1 tetratricopeptide repeat protein [Candidatus Thermoplasmatota archaeon]MBU4592270.1 tetratricopeptide repeat protein [Candidatus Thermoplasmatota archaeon]
MTDLKQLIVGRSREKKILTQYLEKTMDSQGQTILISGEAGIGKSTLVDFLKIQAEKNRMTVCIGESTNQDISIPYLPFQNALVNITEEQIFQTEEFAYFEEVFLISKSGLLISHVSCKKESGMDEDILGSMLTAVQDFVKDSFGGGESGTQKGGLGKLEYMNTKIFIEHGDLVYLAAVTSGEEHPDMKLEIKKVLAEIENKYFDILETWNGDIDSLSGSLVLLESIVDRKFRVKRSLENINIQTERLKVQNRIHELVNTCAQETGLVMVLEDIHWADESTLLAIPFIARNLMESRTLLCITYRPEDMDANPLARNIIENLTSEQGCENLSLERLSGDDIVPLVSNLLGSDKPPEELIRNLESETQGNPFFITEATRALVAEGTLFKDRDVWIMKYGPGSSIPSTVVELVSKRLETLELDALRLLEYGAILGRKFSIDILASGFSMDETFIREILGQLVSLHILTMVGTDDAMFQHSKTQEVIYAGMSERWKRMSHKNAGITYETIHHDNKENVLFNLAYHFSRTLEYDKGIDYSISAGYKASNNLAPREASKYFEKAIELIECSDRKDDRYLEVTQMLGELYELDGNYEKSNIYLDKIIDGSGDNYRSSHALMIKGRIMFSQGKYDDAIALYEKGMALAEKSGSILLKAKIYGYLGKVYLRKGESEKAMELQKYYLNESQMVDSKQDIGQAYMNLGGVYWSMNEPQMAIRHWEISLDIFMKLDFKQGIANLNDNLGVGCKTIGDVKRSLEHYKKSEEIMTMIGDVKGMSMVLLNIGVLYNRIGQYEKSLEYNMKSLQIKKKIGDTVGVANIYNNIGGNYQDMEKFDDALDYYHKNYDLMEKVGDVWGIARSLNNIAGMEIEMGRYQEAKKLCLRSRAYGLEHSFNNILAFSNILLGVISTHDGDYITAIEHYEKGLALGKTTDDSSIIGMAYLYIARHFITIGDNDRATDNYALSYDTFEKSDMVVDSRKVRQEMQKAIEDS